MVDAKGYVKEHVQYKLTNLGLGHAHIAGPESACRGGRKSNRVCGDVYKINYRACFGSGRIDCMYGLLSEQQDTSTSIPQAIDFGFARSCGNVRRRVSGAWFCNASNGVL